MEKNIAALLREDTKTVGVRFFNDPRNGMDNNNSLDLGGTYNNLSAKEYTYVTTLELNVGDIAIVFVGRTPKAVVVTRVDSTCLIDPQDTIEYKWITGVVDFTAFNVEREKNMLISETVAEAYKRNLKAQFQDIVMKNLGRSDKLKLKNILKG